MTTPSAGSGTTWRTSHKPSFSFFDCRLIWILFIISRVKSNVMMVEAVVILESVFPLFWEWQPPRIGWQWYSSSYKMCHQESDLWDIWFKLLWRLKCCFPCFVMHPSEPISHQGLEQLCNIFVASNSGFPWLPKHSKNLLIKIKLQKLKLQFQSLDQTSPSIFWPKFSFKIPAKLQQSLELYQYCSSRIMD